jgi:hypothetical protein
VVLDATLSLMQVAGGAILLAAIARLGVVNQTQDLDGATARQAR